MDELPELVVPSEASVTVSVQATVTELSITCRRWVVPLASIFLKAVKGGTSLAGRRQLSAQ